MICTIIADASFCHQTESAGYGIWIKSNRGEHSAGGNYKTKTMSSVQAEAKALAIAVHMAFKLGLAHKRDRLVIQTDNMQVVHSLQGVNIPSSNIAEPIKYIKQIVKKAECASSYRHVKGHVARRGGKHKVNQICDDLAGEFMRKQRAIT